MIKSSSNNDEIDLLFYEKKLISQNGEDGLFEKIFNLIGTTSKYYVDFGAGNGHFWSNSKYLRKKFGWKGLLLDGKKYPPKTAANLHQEFITAENINKIFEKYKVPQEFDLISIDIDGNDFYVWKSLSKFYSPRVVVIEFNSRFNFDQDRVMKYSPFKVWNNVTEYYGSSILAFYKLGRSLGYSLVYQESCGINLFFIRDDILQSKGIKFKNMNDVSKIYKAVPKYLEFEKEEFITSDEALKLIS